MASIGAQFNTRYPESQNSAVACIPRAEYDSLIDTAHRYANLRQNLLGGGINDHTIELLSSHAAPEKPPANVAAPASVPAYRVAHVNSCTPSTAFNRTISKPLKAHPPQNGRSREFFPRQQADWDDEESYSDDVSVDATPDSQQETHIEPGIGQQRPAFERLATRSIQLVNLPDSTTHADITSVVRGGQLVDIFLRSRDKLASLSFLHGADAQAFYEHVRKNDLYIKDKRVDIQWNDRQYVLPGHIAQKVGFGATRNLVLRRCDPNLTEEVVRDDLDHIHNLVVVKVEFIADNCFISTNSVANAMYARTCMMSRLKYRGTRIEWDLDECAQPVDRMPIRHTRAPSAPPVKKAMNPMANRFQLLKLDD